MTAAPAGAGPGSGKIWACYAIAAALVLSPLLWAEVPPLVDYPNHLARDWILADAGRYTVAWRVVPYLGMDAVVVALSAIMPVELAGRVFVALSIMAPLAGTAALYRVLHGRCGLWPLAALLSVYNYMLFYGFVVCLLALGLAMLAFAGGLATESWAAWRRAAAFAPVAVLLVLCHLFGLLLYGLLVAGDALGGVLAARGDRWRATVRAAVSGVQAVPALAVLAVGHQPALAVAPTQYGDLASKLVAVLAPFNFSHQPAPLDLATWLFAVLAMYFALSRRWLRIAPRMVTPLAVVTVAALLMPNWLHGVWGTDARLPVALPLLLVGAATPAAPRPRWASVATAAAAVLLALRLWTVSQSFADYDRWFGEFRAAAAAMPVGARLLPVAPPATPATVALPGVPSLFATLQPEVFHQMPALAVIDRSAFFPYLFADWFTVRVNPARAEMAQAVGLPATPAQLAMAADPATAASADALRNEIGERPYWRHWPADFDTVLWLGDAPQRAQVPPQLQPLARGRFFTLFRVQK